MGGVWSFPSPAYSTPIPIPYPISFYDYSLTDTATANGATKSQILTGSPSMTGNLTQSKTTTFGQPFPGIGTSTSSIAAALNPASTFITQTLSYTDTSLHNHGGSNFLPTASSVFSVDFNGTGHRAGFYVNYFANDMNNLDGDADFDYFQTDLSLNVTKTKMGTHNTTQVAYLNGFYSPRTGLLNTGNFTGNVPYNSVGLFTVCCTPGPFFLTLATQSNTVYTVSLDMNTQLFGGGPASFAGAGSAMFQLVANTPEPSTILLLTSGLAIIALINMKSRKEGHTKPST